MAFLYPPPRTLLNFNTWYGIFSRRPPNFQSQLSFLKLLPNVIVFFTFFFFFLRTWQIEDSGQNKRWKIFFEGHFLKSFFCLSSCDTVIFNPFFFLLHSQNSCRASSSRNSWSLLWLHFSILAKRHFYSMFLKSTLPIFNVSTLGQLSDLFLRLVFTPPSLPLLKYWCHAVLVAVCCTFVIFIFYFFGHCSILRFGFGRDSKKKREKKKGVKGFSIIFTFFLLSHGVPPVPSGPPRKVEVEAVNSSSIKVIWRSPMPTKQHGQIRGYQVHYVRMVNGEPTGQPAIKDILIDDAQVQHPHPTLSQPPPHLRHIMFFSLTITNYCYVSLIIYSA